MKHGKVFKKEKTYKPILNRTQTSLRPLKHIVYNKASPDTRIDVRTIVSKSSA